MVTNVAKAYFYERVGEQIRSERERQKISRQKLADDSALTMTTVEHVEEGRSCSLFAFIRIATALDVNMNDLVPLDAMPP